MNNLRKHWGFNLNIKKIILILLLIGIISALSISTINAQDLDSVRGDFESSKGLLSSVDTQNLNTGDDLGSSSLNTKSDLEAYSASSSSLNLKGDSKSYPDSIFDAIYDAKDNDIIYLDNKTYDGIDNTEIIIDKSISLIGSDNTIIDAQNKYYIFKINDNLNVTFENISFVNAFKMAGKEQDAYGAALEIGNSNVVIKNCKFIGNSITYGEGDFIYGAAISSLGNLTITDSYFLNNSLRSYWMHDGFGGAIYNRGNLSIDNTSFINTTGGNYAKGSVLYNDGIAIINNSVIANTYTEEESMGSAIFNNNNLTLLNSIVENNTIERFDFNFIYGNIFNSGIFTAMGNIFRNNTAYYKQPNAGYDGCPTIYNVGALNLSHNAFIDNIGGFKKVYTDIFLNGGNDVYLSDNWWGGNDNPYSNQKINEDKVSSWIVLDVAPEYSSIALNETVNITASWKTSDGFDSDFDIPFDLIFTTSNKIQKEIFTGESVFTFTNTQNKGLYEINVTVGSFTNTALVDVGKINIILKCDLKSEIYPNEYLVLNISLEDENSNPVDGNIIININGEETIVSLENGKTRTVFTKLLPDNYTLSLRYDGNDIYSKAFNQTEFIVKKYSIDLSIDDIDDIMVGEGFTAKIRLKTSECEGPANIYINGEFKDTVYLTTGLTQIGFYNFHEGRYNITVEIEGNEYYEKTAAVTVFSVYRYETLLNLTCDDINVDENAIITISSAYDFRGDVVLSINGYETVLFIENRTNEYVLSNLGAGVYDIDLKFDGNDLYLPYNTNASFTVFKLPSDLSVEIKDEIMHIKTSSIDCTGNVTIHINQNHFIQNLTDGEANFTMVLQNGTNYIQVIYGGDDRYYPSSWNTTIGEGEAYALISSNITGWEYNNFTYSVQLFEENGMAMPYRMITISLDSNTYEVETDANGTAFINLNLMQGNYTVISTYKNLTAENTISINPIEFSLSSINASYGEDILIEVIFNESVTGYVNFTLDNLTYISNINDGKASLNISEVSGINDGKASWTIEDLECGIYKLEAYYFNDYIRLDTHESIVSVDKLDSNITLEISEASLGEDELISINADGLTGTLNITVDNDEYHIDITNGKANLTLSGLSKGMHELTIEYTGDEHHKNVTVYRSFTIKSSRTAIVLEVNSTDYMQDIIVVAKLNRNATGTVLFTLKAYGNGSSNSNGKGGTQSYNASSLIKDGMAIWNFTGPDVGRYRVYANYLGDDDFISSQNSSSFTVNKAESSIEVFVKEAFLDENIRFYARLSPNATGKVTFWMKDYYSPRDKDVKDSMATWLISPLESGQYFVYATYRGDDNYYSSTTEYILNISLTRSYISVEANDASNADNVTIKVKLVSERNELITGVTKIYFNGDVYDVDIIGGNGTLVLGRLDVGNYTFQASFEGDDKYSRSSVNSSFNVYDSLIESRIIISDFRKYYNNTVNFTAVLLSAGYKPISDAEVTVEINGIEKTYISDGEGKICIDTDYPLGNYSVKVSYEGSNSFYPAEANATLYVLSTIESGDVVKLYGSGTQYLAIFRDLNGKALMSSPVYFIIGNKTYNYTTQPNGIVRLNIGLNPGLYNITAFNPVSGENKTNSIFVFKKIMENRDVTNYFGAKSTYKVRLYGNDGNPLGEGNIVVFKVNGKTYKVKSDKNGYAKLSVSLNPKQYTITAEFNGTKVSNKITVKPVLTCKISSNKKTKKTKFTAKLINTKGKALKGKKITFKINGKKYTAKTNKNGVATLSIKLKLKKGTYKVYTIYGKSKVTSTIRVK